MKKAKDIMNSEVVTVTPETTVKELARLFSYRQISGAPVVDKTGKVISVVTESDLIDQTKKVHIPTVVTILDSVFYLENPDKMEKEMKKIAGYVVKDICSDNLITVEGETPLDEIATIMAEKNVHTLPVLSDGKLIGVIGKKDIIRTLIN